MRVSTPILYSAGADRIVRQQAEWLRTQQQLASGRRMLAPSDDPVASAQALRVGQSHGLGAQYAANQAAAERALSLAESSLAEAGDTIQGARVLLVQAANGTLTEADRRAIALDLRARFGHLIALANARDADGQYLFSGYQGAREPFVPTAAGAQYQGDEGERLLAVAGGRMLAVSVSGAEIFERVPAGNGRFVVVPGTGNRGSATHDGGTVEDAAAWTGHRYRVQFSVFGGATTYDVHDLTAGTTVASGRPYVPGQPIAFDGVAVAVNGAPADGDLFELEPGAVKSAFDALHEVAALLEAPLASDGAARARFANGITAAMQSLEQAQARVLEVRARVGASLAELESLQALVSAGMLQDASELSRLADLDYAEAASRFAAQQRALEAAQRSYVRVASLSLFDFI